MIILRDMHNIVLKKEDLTKDDKPVTVNFPQTELIEETEKYIKKIKEKNQ